MATTAPVRRIAYAIVALAFASPGVLLGGVAWAQDPTPVPVEKTTVEAPVVQPSAGSWIIGGTLLEGSAGQPAKPAAKPAAKPVAKPVAKSVVKPATTTTRTTSTTTRTTRRTTSHPAAVRHTTSSATAPDGATALPFTGNRADALIPTGIALVVGGLVLLLAGRPRRVLA